MINWELAKVMLSSSIRFNCIYNSYISKRDSHASDTAYSASVLKWLGAVTTRNERTAAAGLQSVRSLRMAISLLIADPS